MPPTNPKETRCPRTTPGLIRTAREANRRYLCSKQLHVERATYTPTSRVCEKIVQPLADARGSVCRSLPILSVPNLTSTSDANARVPGVGRFAERGAAYLATRVSTDSRNNGVYSGSNGFVSVPE